jgi:hypothetical protein
LNCAAVWARAGRPSPAPRLAVYRDRDVAHRTGDGVRAVASVQVDPQSPTERARSRRRHQRCRAHRPAPLQRPDEARATLAIRDGRAEGVEFYDTHDRIRSGARHELIDRALAAWESDQTAGLDTLLIAASTADVTALNARARLARVHAGTVEALGIELVDGCVVGVGDLVVTRRNDRRLITDTRGFVKNGDAWTVHRRHRDGGLTLVRADHAQVRLPHDYVAQHLELGYATTAARAQGRTEPPRDVRRLH